MRSGASWVWGQVLWHIVRWGTFVVPVHFVMGRFPGHLVSNLIIVAWTGLLFAALLTVLRTAHTVAVGADGNAVFQSALRRVTVPVHAIRSIEHRPNSPETVVRYAGGELRVRPEAPGLPVLAERVRMVEIFGAPPR